MPPSFPAFERTKKEDGGGSPSSSSSSSDSEVEDSCRMCGGKHREIRCPHLTMNKEDRKVESTPTASSEITDYAEHESETVYVKGLSNLILPNIPVDSGQARGYINQVLMNIGSLQKTPGSDLYHWAQECLTKDDSALRDDRRFPRTDREIATKMLKVCKSGRFGIIFQRMVEESRLSGIGMPCGRVMLATIFRHFQLEKDRIGMLGERNLLTLRLKGHKTEDLITFQEKYRYILAAIPSEDLPRETTLFNHLLDELEQFTPLATKIAKSRESPLGSHRRSTKWLWEKVDLYIELERVKANRQAFDKKLRDSHTADLATTYNPKAIPANPAKTDKPKKEKSKEDKKKEKKEKKEKAKKEKQQQPLQQPVDVHAAPGPKSKAPRGPPKAKPRGNTPTPPTSYCCGRAGPCASCLFEWEDLLAMGHRRWETFVRQTSLNFKHETTCRPLTKPCEFYNRGGCPTKCEIFGV